VKVDHKNGDGLDNRLKNIRRATQGENNANSRKQRRSTSSLYKGVYSPRDAARRYKRPWRGQLKHEGRVIWTQCFATEAEAARAYNSKAIEVFGEFARLNEFAPAIGEGLLSDRPMDAVG